jgi:hypothetical protein
MVLPTGSAVNSQWPAHGVGYGQRWRLDGAVETGARSDVAICCRTPARVRLASMPAKWTISHTFQVILGAIVLGLIASLTALSKDPTYGPWVQPVLAVLVVLSGYFGITSGKGANGIGGGGGAAILMVFVGGTWISACQAAAPTANLGACILADVAKQDTIAQIALDCGADIPSVLIALLESVDPAVLASKAHAEAVTVQAASLREAARK